MEGAGCNPLRAMRDWRVRKVCSCKTRSGRRPFRWQAGGEMRDAPYAALLKLGETGLHGLRVLALSGCDSKEEMVSLLTDDCPRCGATHVTFDVAAQNSRGIVRYGWSEQFEVFAVCRHCHKSTVFLVANKNYDSRGLWPTSGVVSYNGYLNDHFEVTGYINIKDQDAESPPEHVPDDIAAVFSEGSTCVAVECWNAAGAMFRLAVDMTTKSLLPPDGEPPLAKIRRSLGFRLEWLFQNGKLPTDLQELAECIKEDGNDGAHDGTLTKNEALDLQEFTFNLLERLYTAPKKLELAAARRRERRGEG